MDRFSEEYPTVCTMDRDEDGFPDAPEVEQFTCASCCRDQAIDQVGAEEEAECTCIFSGDYVDNRHCDAHGSRRGEPVLICKSCVAPATQDFSETLVLLAKSGCGLSETAAYLNLIEREVA